MIVKVCGMREGQNIQALSKLDIDWMGFIFYHKSKRFIDRNAVVVETEGIKRVGVFVNENLNEVLEIASNNRLDMVQLHGEESPEFCLEIRDTGIEVMKAFSIDPEFKFDQISRYEGSVDYFLFDAKGAERGGNGIRYDWSILKNYSHSIPFLIAGGINSNSSLDILSFNHPMWKGVDLNSGFESVPAVKDVQAIKDFVDTIRVAI